MNKKLIIAVATSLILTNGASAAFALKTSDSHTTPTPTTTVPTSTTVPEESDKNELIDRQKAAKNDAKAAFKAARDSATTDEARKAARETFQAAGKALGAPPAKPAKAEDTK